MSPALILLVGFTTLLLILVAWILLDPHKSTKHEADQDFAEESDRRHATYFRQVRQALAPEDFIFLASRSSHGLDRKVRKERRRIALAYLTCLHGDFLKLWRLARAIASLSPQVGVAQEIARLRLAAAFSVRYELLRAKLHFGFCPTPELGSLSEVVGRLAIRLETAMQDLGERAALATKVASSLDGRDLNTP